MTTSFTLLYAGFLGIILFGLSMRVVRVRQRLQVKLGSGGHDELERAIRAHANFVEYVPMTLLLLYLVESSATMPLWVIHVLGLALVVARLLHGFGLNRTSGLSAGRWWGTAVTWLVLLILAVIGAALGGGRLGMMLAG